MLSDLQPSPLEYLRLSLSAHQVRCREVPAQGSLGHVLLVPLYCTDFWRQAPPTPQGWRKPLPFNPSWCKWSSHEAEGNADKDELCCKVSFGILFPWRS